jgi:hypothetical protein
VRGRSITFDEVLLRAADGHYGVYVQVKQVDGEDRTDAILDRLRLS